MRYFITFWCVTNFMVKGVQAGSQHGTMSSKVKDVWRCSMLEEKPMRVCDLMDQFADIGREEVRKETVFKLNHLFQRMDCDINFRIERIIEIFDLSEEDAIDIARRKPGVVDLFVEKGKEEAKEKFLRKTIESLHKVNFSDDVILKSIMDVFGLSIEEAIGALKGTLSKLDK